jgi:hypothetical protein
MLRAFRKRLLGKNLVVRRSTSPPYVNDLERRPGLPPPACNDVVLEILEIDVSHFGQHISGKVDRKSAGTQQIVVRIVGMTCDVGLQREVDRLGEHLLQASSRVIEIVRPPVLMGNRSL